MLISVCLQLRNDENTCIASKSLLSFTNLVVYLIFCYSLVDILRLKIKDKKTPLKVIKYIIIV